LKRKQRRPRRRKEVMEAEVAVASRRRKRWGRSGVARKRGWGKEGK
jgi:hypothetical protein